MTSDELRNSFYFIIFKEKSANQRSDTQALTLQERLRCSKDFQHSSIVIQHFSGLRFFMFGAAIAMFDGSPYS